MIFTCYILKSQKSGKFYIGHTNDINRRFIEHNSGQTKSTKSGIPWDIVFTKTFNSKTEAAAFETFIKKMKSRKFIEDLTAKAR